MSDPTKVNKVALVTGGARRVGKAICMLLHKNEFNIVIHCNTSMEEALKVSGELNRIRDNSAEVICGDLSKNIAETTKQIVDKAEAKWGRLDLVVNNASTFASNTLHNVTPEQFDLAIDVNLKAPIFVMQAAGDYLKRQNGCIVNLSDLVGLKPKETHFSHSISKAALISATMNAALTLAPEVRVNAIVPGCVEWPEVEPRIFHNEEKQKWINNTPLNKIGSPDDVAEAVVFLSSPGANFITGQILKIDGGRGLKF